MEQPRHVVAAEREVWMAQLWTMRRRRTQSSTARCAALRVAALAVAGFAVVCIQPRLLGFVSGALLWHLSPQSRCARSTRSAAGVGRERSGGHLDPNEFGGAANMEDDGSYDVDLEYANGDLLEKTVQETRYFGVTLEDGVELLLEPDGEFAEELLLPGDVVATEVTPDGRHGRLLNGRGWLPLTESVEEVDPWAAQILKKPGIDKDDAEALAYLSLDTDSLTPLAEHLPLPQRVVKELQKRGVAKASPIQEEVFDRVLRGESLCLQSQTGSGKTLAMMLPLLTAMSEESAWGEEGDKIIVVTASRELAVQLYSDIDNMGFFPPAQGFATMIIVGSIPPKESIQKANVIIGTANELGGVLHKDRDLIEQLNTQLRAIVLDEVDDYTSAPKIFASKWAIKKKRRVYNEQKGLLKDRTGIIEYFIKRSLGFSRRKDLQVLAASATLSRPMAKKVFRLLRWDPLGRWYNKPPPLVRPSAAAKIDWQSVPRVATVPLHVQHRFVQVVKGRTDTVVRDKHWKRKGIGQGGIARRIKIRAAAGQQRGPRDGSGARPISNELAASMIDALHDALKSRPVDAGSSLVIVCDSVGITVRDTMFWLRKRGLFEAEAVHRALWDDPVDWPSRWAIKYSYDLKDHAPELAERHRALNERLANSETVPLPVGSPEWKTMEVRKKCGECQAPVMVGHEGLGRGLHLDGVDTVYILGLPQKPSIYMHLAGRVGRLGQEGGKVVSIVPKRGVKVLDSWANQIGPGVHFELEPIDRIRSAPAVTPRQLPSGQRRPRRDRQTAPEEDEDLKSPRGVPLLPEGEDYVPMPGFGERDEQKDREVARIKEVAKRSRQPDEVAARRLAAQLARVTNPI